MVRVYTEVESINDFHFWAGALDTVNTIIDNDKEQEFLQLLEDVFSEEPVNEVTLNDFVWFDRDYIFEQLGIEE